MRRKRSSSTRASITARGTSAPRSSISPSVTIACMCGMPVAVGAEGLDGGDHARQGVSTLQHLLEAAARRLVGCAAQDAEQSPLALEEPPERLGHREHHVAVRDGQQHDLDEEGAQQRGPLGLAAWAEVACLAGEGQQVLGLAVRTAQAPDGRHTGRRAPTRAARRSS